MQGHLQMGISLVPAGLLSSLLLLSDHAGLCRQVHVIPVPIWTQVKAPRTILEMPQAC